MQKENKLIPYLRFKGFDGEWYEDYLDNLGTIKMCKRVFKNQTSKNKEIPFFTIKTLGQKADTFISNELYTLLREKYNYPNIGQTLITCSGTIGKTATHNGEDSYFQDSNIIWVDFFKNNIEQYFFKKIIDRQNWNFLAKTSISRLYNKDLYSLLIKFPSIHEQQKIARFFSLLDKQIELYERKLNNYNLLYKYYLNKIFSKEDGIPTLRFKGFDDKWELKKLGDISNIKTGTKDLKDKNDNGKYPFYVRSQKIEKINSFSYDGEAILIPGDGRIGDIFHYINGKFDYHQRVYKISDAKEWLKFIYCLFQKNIKKHLMTYSAKATVDSLRLPMLLNFKLSVPSVNEQQKIASFFDKIDQLREKTKQTIIHLNNQKKYYLKMMFI